MLYIVTKIWKHLRGKKKASISLRNLKVYLAAIMNLQLPWMVFLRDSKRSREHKSELEIRRQKVSGIICFD